MLRATDTRRIALMEGCKDLYQYSPSRSSTATITSRLAASWRFSSTPIGFITVLYSLLVAGWGGMLLLLLCKAAPALCRPNCDDIDSPRRIWIEIDLHILNSLICLPALVFAPRRFRDLLLLVRYLIAGDFNCLRTLAGFHQSWYRIQDSGNLLLEISAAQAESWLLSQPAFEGDEVLREKSMLGEPLTGLRSPPTPIWKLASVVGLKVMNTVFQVVVLGFLWGYNRHNRPNWPVPVFLCLAVICGGTAILTTVLEERRIRTIEICERVGRKTKRNICLP